MGWVAAAAAAVWLILAVMVLWTRQPWPIEPTPPQGVRLVIDGQEIPVECVYAGVDATGLHVWRAVWTYYGRPQSIKIGVLPAWTRVEAACMIPPDGC